MNKIICLCLIIGISQSARSQKTVLYDVYSVWQDRDKPAEKARFFFDAYRDTLNRTYRTQELKKPTRDRNKDRPVYIRDIQQLIMEMEGPNRNLPVTHCTIGFYFYDAENNLVIDMFRFDKPSMLISGFETITLGKMEHDTSIRKRAYACFARLKNPVHTLDPRHQLFHQYLLPYQAEYYSHARYQPGLDSAKLGGRDFNRPMNVNGKMPVKDVFNEIEKALNSLNSTAFRRPGGYGIIDIFEVLKGSMAEDRRYINYQKSYRYFFEKRPILLEYIYLALEYQRYQRTPPNSSQLERFRKAFVERLNAFVATIDLGVLHDEDVKYFAAYGTDITEVRNTMLIRASQILQKDHYKEKADKARRAGDLPSEIRAYYNLVKYNGGADNYKALSKLFAFRNQRYDDLIREAHTLKAQEKYQSALDSALKASIILPYRLETSRLINELRDSLNRQMITLSAAEKKQVELKTQSSIVETQLTNIFTNAYSDKSKISDRTFYIEERNGREITIKITPDVDETDLTARISYYPLGKHTYALEEVDNQCIIQAISAMYSTYSVTNAQGQLIPPIIDLYFTGSADLTGYRGEVGANTEYIQTEFTVIDCAERNLSQSFQYLRRSEATKKEKNLALACLRAYHKEKNIRARCLGKINSSTNCGMVIPTGSSQKADPSQRAVVVTVKVMVGE